MSEPSLPLWKPRGWTPPPNWPPPPSPGWQPPAGWTPDPAWGPAPRGWRFWPDGPPTSAANAAAAPYGVPAPSTVVVQPTGPTYRGPARTAHGPGYWLLVGFWWGPLKWAGRVALWLIFFPLGLWRSIVHGRKAREARERRGFR